MTSLPYAVNEAFRTLRRAGRSAAMSIGTIAVAFLALGGFLLASANLQALVDRWASTAEMSVYLRDDVEGSVREALLGDLRAHAAVESVEYVSQQQALERFRRDFPEIADVAASAGTAFPASIEVRLRTDPALRGAADAMAEQLSTRDGVADVRYDREWLSRLTAIIRSIRVAGLTIAGVLVLGAAFTVGAVVRLSLQGRSDEVDIMQLVGAPFSFIRGPSIAEGTLLGGIGAVIALTALWVLFMAARTQLEAALSALGSVGALRFLGVGESLLLVVTGLAVGGIAGLMASRTARD